MDSINTVNFEDLFDFSPEPAAPGHQQQTSVGGASGGVLETADEALEKPRSTNQYQDNKASNALDAPNNSSTAANRDVFADFEAVISGDISGRRDNSSTVAPQYHQLSASVPINWNSHHSGLTGGGTSDNQFIRASKDSLSSSGTEFTVGSVDQLLQSLPIGRDSTLIETPAEPVAPLVVKSKRGRKPGQKSLRTDMKTKLERSRQSARECRARKKLRYQYLDDLILEREKANEQLREELIKYQKWCHELDKGRIPDGLQDMLREFKNEQQANL